MQRLHYPTNWLAGLQWLFFMFANIVVIPITVGEAFQLTQSEIASLLQLSFLLTGLACLVQVFLGHNRPIMEGQSGLWWGVFITLVTTTSAQGMSLAHLGGSLALGVIISGVVTVLIGLTGIGPRIAKLFTANVMGVFVLLLAFTLMQIFVKGMFGIPFGSESELITLNVPIGLLSIFVVIIVILISILSPRHIRSYALLIGITIGWIAYMILFGQTTVGNEGVGKMTLFPFGSPVWDTGVVATAVMAGILNISNTYGALLGTNEMFNRPITKKQYAATFSITGVTNIASGFLGLVPYAPYVSSIGFLRQTAIYDRLPFIIGSGLFVLMGIIKPVGAFFSLLPLSIGSAVLFVAYLQLFQSAFEYFKSVRLTAMTVYRSAIPLFFGTIIMMFPAHYFESIPSFIRPFISNGLLVGIVLALILEIFIDWDTLGERQKKG